MDIDLLSRMVKEVVMDHDTVTLPGVGSFVTELVPATFADRGYTILPPYRRLYFSPTQGEDTLLVDFYAQANRIPVADASRILTDFLSEMKEVLKVKKTIVFPGLGRLRATRENHFFSWEGSGAEGAAGSEGMAFRAFFSLRAAAPFRHLRMIRMMTSARTASRIRVGRASRNQSRKSEKKSPTVFRPFFTAAASFCP